MSATRSARVATSRSWASVFSSWVPKMAGWSTPQFSPYLRSMFRYCLLLIGVLPGVTAPAASQQPDTLRDRLEARIARSEEHTSELQSLRHLVCRLLLEKKKKKI